MIKELVNKIVSLKQKQLEVEDHFDLLNRLYSFLVIDKNRKLEKQYELIIYLSYMLQINLTHSIAIFF